MNIYVNGADISRLVETVSWSGDENQMARKLSFTYLYTSHDPNIEKIEVTYGNRILMLEEGQPLFDGVVLTEEKTESGVTKSITAYDYAWYLKSKVHGTFKGTPPAVAAAVCSQEGILTGMLYGEAKEVKIVSTGEKTIYQVITEAYDGLDCHVYMEGQVLCVEKYGTELAGTVTGDDYVTDATYKASIENMVNRVGILSGDKLVGEVTGLGAEYGQIREYYKAESGKDSQEEARKLLKGIEESGKIVVKGNSAYQTGKAIIIQKVNSRIQGMFTIISDEHSLSNAQYTTTLGLRFEEVV